MDFLLKVFVILGVLMQYTFTVLSITYKKYSLFAIVYVFSIFFYDFLFINASYFLPGAVVALLKPYNEYLFLFLAGRLALLKYGNIISKRQAFDNMITFLVLPSAIVLLMNDFTANIDLNNTVLGIRIYLLPILLPFLMYKAGWLEHINKKKLLSALFIITLVTIGYGALQQLSYNGNIKSLWFYKFFDSTPENPIEVGFYNFIRNDKLRTTSFFVSPIIYSIAIAMTAVFVVNLLAMTKSKVFKRNLLLLILVGLIYGLVIAETRVGIFILAMATVMVFITRLTTNKKTYKIMAVLPIFAVILTFITLIYGYTDDLSALGRLVQYLSFFDYFKPLGLGFNSEYVLTMFDTYYMSLGLVYGVFIIFPIYFYYKINNALYDKILELEGLDLIFAKGVFILSLTFLYSFAFQFTAGAYQYRMLFFLMFLVFASRSKYVTTT